jgi:hypothetical protein
VAIAWARNLAKLEHCVLDKARIAQSHGGLKTLEARIQPIARSYSHRRALLSIVSKNNFRMGACREVVNVNLAAQRCLRQKLLDFCGFTQGSHGAAI